jgi:hypothetical protein
MRPLVATVTVAAVSLAAGGCASRRALRESATAEAALQVPSARRAYYQAALSVMTAEGYSPLHAAEPDGFSVYHERLRPQQGGAACEDVRLDASFDTGDDRATLVFNPCLVESEGALFAENGLEICVPQPEWRDASCIDAAIARLKHAWRSRAQQIMSREAPAPGAPGASARPPASFTSASLEEGLLPGACTKDAECKGNRSCVSSRCADPARR